MFMTLRYSRRHLLQTLGLSATGIAGATLLAACGGTTATTTTATVTQTVTKASVSTATVAKTIVKATTQTVTASVASLQSPMSNKGKVSWLIRTSLSERCQDGILDNRRPLKLTIPLGETGAEAAEFVET